jgi:hypothetical protein
MVLGMHRSGTSALAGALHHAGATAGDDLMGEGPNNRKGYFESEAVLAHMEGLLQACGSFWHDWRALDLAQASKAELRTLRRGLHTHLEAQFAQAPVFTIKDPRICRAYPFWVRVLETFGATRTAVITVRHPAEVAASLATRNGMSLDKALMVWLRHVLDAELATRGQSRVFLTYDQVIADLPGVLGRIYAALPADAAGVMAPAAFAAEGFVDETLRHNRVSAAEAAAVEAVAPWFLAAWQAMQAYAEAGLSEGREAELDAARIGFEAASAPFAAQFAASEWLIGGLRQQLSRIGDTAEAARQLTPASPRQANALRTRGKARRPEQGQP